MSKTVPFPLPVAGIDVLSNETSLEQGAVRSAVNVDLGRAGQFSRRPGTTQKLAAAGLHSLYHSTQRGWTFVATPTGLARLDTKTMTMTDLLPLAAPAPVDYVEYNGNVYFTNRYTAGWLPSNSSVVRRIGVPTPPPPTMSASPNGALLPGRYGLIMTAVDDRGEESAACAMQSIDLPQGGSIQLTNLPQQLGMSLMVYITAPDDDQLRHTATFPAVFPTYSVANPAQGMPCPTRGLTPLAPGDFIRWHNGRLYTAGGSSVRFSEAMRPHLYDPAHNVIPFSGPIAFIETVVDGIYVGDSRGVWFLAGGDPEKFELVRVSPHRAVPRSSLLVAAGDLPPKAVDTDKPVAVWLTSVGYIAGTAGGNVVELNSKQLRLPPGQIGRSAFTLREGRKQVLTLVNSQTAATLGTAVDSVIATP